MPRKRIKVVEQRLGRHLTKKERRQGYAVAGVYYDGVIKIDPDLSEKDRLGTLLHEAFHKWGVRTKFTHELEEEGHPQAEAAEEADVRALEEAVRDLLWSQGYRRVLLG